MGVDQRSRDGSGGLLDKLREVNEAEISKRDCELVKDFPIPLFYFG